MKAEHGIAVVGILAAEVEDSLTGFEIDARHQYFGDASLTSAGYHLGAVGCELLTIEVTMGIDKG
jgi:hypothetical protein